jgi:predicted nucleic acid-binding protein
MLDTNMCIYLIRRQPPQVLEHFQRQTLGDIGISTVTLAELHYGAAKSQFPERNRHALEAFILPLDIVFRRSSSGCLWFGTSCSGTPWDTDRRYGHADRSARTQPAPHTRDEQHTRIRQSAGTQRRKLDNLNAANSR